MLQTVSRNNQFWNGLLHLADPKIWVASLVPFLLGNCLAFANGAPPNWHLFFAALLVLILVEVGKNGVNEYYDYLSGADTFVEPWDKTPFSGGKKVILDRLLSLREVGWISFLSLSAAVLLSIIIIIVEQPATLIFGVIGLSLAVAYSMPPLQLSYRGFGESTVGFVFGPVIVTGAYFLQTGRIATEPVLLSIPIGFLIANVLWINEVPDASADRKAGKMTLVARIGRENSLSGYVILFVFAGLSLIAAAFITRHYSYLLALASYFLVPAAIRRAKRNLLDSQQLMPANSLTIKIYLLTGVVLSIAAFLQ